ncbi:outer membrane lipoprotein-sorting protein [Halorhabdus amylolytica]|uniref:outer membrane lipoprotein-sorting protein n=1 Tax=Halorhabdus amylolytica TaxID=2559573 RepID=UPI0010AA3EFF|nr:DUF4367 domain-containing protein [Halorhabdus amylolytica]
MASTNRRPAVLVILLAAALLTSGIAGITFAETPSTTDAQTTEELDGDEVIDSFVERLSTLETAEFTRTSESEFGNETSTRTVHVFADFGDFQKRTETVNTTVGSNTTTVMNESTVLTYNADENTVTEFEVSGDRILLPTLNALSNESLVSYEFTGTETVEGENAYVLEGTPQLQGETEGETSLTVYVDTETYFPVRMESESTGEKYTYSSTITHRNVTLDEEIPDSTFELDVPADASEPSEYVGPDVSSYESYDNLSTSATLSLPAEELAAGFNFEEGTIVDGEDYYSISLRYTDGEETISVNTRTDSFNESIYEESDRYEAVEIGDTMGYRYASDEFTSLHWADEQAYSLYGEIENETAMDIAESIVAE